MLAISQQTYFWVWAVISVHIFAALLNIWRGTTSFANEHFLGKKFHLAIRFGGNGFRFTTEGWRPERNSGRSQRPKRALLLVGAL
jgi:hypothetical protein